MPSIIVNVSILIFNDHMILCISVFLLYVELSACRPKQTQISAYKKQRRDISIKLLSIL